MLARQQTRTWTQLGALPLGVTPVGLLFAGYLTSKHRLLPDAASSQA